ncbi:MAG TPA: cyclic nucleotide-binding domain-containing protein [Acidimicrobiales bacterium]|nr:cyclic nucleotide-binding domain-containing protein [Acidimicrobiales bacterium]
MKLLRKRTDPVAQALEAAGIAPADAQRLVSVGTAIAVEPGVRLCTEGEFGREAFVLVSGEAVVRLPGTDRSVRPGEVVGEIAALNPKMRRTATVETTATSVVLAYDVRSFRALAAEMADHLVPDRAA